MQFAGLSIIVRYLGVQINPVAAVVMASVVAFTYVGLSGIKGSAYVAILKDILMVTAIAIGGITAVVQMPGGLEAIYRQAYEKFPAYLTVVTVPVGEECDLLNLDNCISSRRFLLLALSLFNTSSRRSRKRL